jgi:hypothetical protein
MLATSHPLEPIGIKPADDQSSEIAALAGHWSTTNHLPTEVGRLALMVVVGSWFGAHLGSRWLSPRQIHVFTTGKPTKSNQGGSPPPGASQHRLNSHPCEGARMQFHLAGRSHRLLAMFASKSTVRFFSWAVMSRVNRSPMGLCCQMRRALFPGCNCLMAISGVSRDSRHFLNLLKC